MRRNERVGVERKNGGGVCGGTEERNVVQRAGVGSDEEGRICDLIQRKFFEGQQFMGDDW